MIILYTAITIGFLNTSYVVNESDGTVTLTVCVLEGTFDKDVDVTAYVRFSMFNVSAYGNLL